MEDARMLEWIVMMSLVCAPVPRVAEDPLGHGYLGVIINQTQLTLDTVMANSPAERAGLQTGDKLLKINDFAPTKFDDATTQLRNFRPGSPITLVVMRNGKELKLQATLTTRPPENQINLSP
jgi:serine protease Do